MTALLIDGSALAASIRADVARRVAKLPFRPCLAVVLVGDDPASASYVRNKDKAAVAAGIDARTIRLPAATDQATVLDRINILNSDESVDGILVQLPLPAQIDPAAILAAVDPSKDVDGFHPVNVGLLASGRPGLVPCTPLGVMRLLNHANILVAGARAVVQRLETIETERLRLRPVTGDDLEPLAALGAAAFGLGPGPPGWITPETTQALSEATDLVGYYTYLDRVPVRSGQDRHGSDNGRFDRFG